MGAKDLWEWGSKSIILFRWYSRLRDGRVQEKDDERSGRPKSTRTEVNIAAADLVKNDGRIATTMTAETLNSLKTVVLRILKGFLFSRIFLVAR
jgi:hypothetical protein